MSNQSNQPNQPNQPKSGDKRRLGWPRFVFWITRRGWLRLSAAAALLVIAVTVLYSEIPTAKTWTFWTTPLSGKVIALDAGHGGPDGGAESQSGIIEKDINMAIVHYLRDYLQQAGALVILTREGDYDLAGKDVKGYSKRKTQDLLSRVELIQSRKADLALSIHMNSVPSPNWSGAQSFYFSGRQESIRLATVIQSEIRETLGNTNRTAIKNDKVYLLRTLTMPTALIEIGFLSHPQEARLLADEDYQKKVAAALYRGILRYSSGEGSGAKP
ncbi:N-acetylmuramoyl-L-alanine amidase CwlD [Cohnella sp. AR92]|uniref:N-acetylmuramoyl-L-alanine amidase CwlD n=1 Tax=Cohnella sp. AR92 TaxID=648716 RepID=UPI000F8CB1F4|nr:N-acetylmuramoyl-L-alanine amidase CwlD [Cohnella sp. AR92]RUS44300.1 N-acetylmuramoyl-L-alanine amidase CwlD [Cohnella sp. AR92]